MKLIDNTSLAEIVLTNEFLWEDEFKWSKVVNVHSYSLAGSLIVESGVKLEGRPITLGGDGEGNWVTRATLQELVNASNLPNRKFTLKLEYPTDTREFAVIFAPGDSPIEAEAVKGFPGHEDGDWFRVTIKLVEWATT